MTTAINGIAAGVTGVAAAAAQKLAGSIVVTPEELLAQSTKVQALAGELKEHFDEVLKLVKSTEHFWTGDASRAHRENYTKHGAELEEIVARYREHSADLEKMAGVYREAEAQAAGLVDDLPASTL